MCFEFRFVMVDPAGSLTQRELRVFVESQRLLIPNLDLTDSRAYLFEKLIDRHLQWHRQIHRFDDGASLGVIVCMQKSRPKDAKVLLNLI